jgi:hypothetical protein
MANTVKINSTKIVQEVSVVSQPNLTKVYIVNQNANAFIGQNNTWREVFLGFYENPSGFNNLFEQELIVSETENIMLITAKTGLIGEPVILERYKFARGKGTWNPIPKVIGQDIIFESSSNVSGGDIPFITQGGNTQSYNLGDITGTNIWDFVNANGPYDTTSPQLTYLFIAIEDGVTNLYNFIGANGIYGDGYLTSVEADFVLISTSETTPQVAFNLTVEEFEEIPISFVNKLIFNGATVTDNADGSVTITITGGGATPSLQAVLAVGDRDADVFVDDYTIVATDRNKHWITDVDNVVANIEIEITNDSFFDSNLYSVYIFTNTTDFDVTFVNNSDFVNVGTTNLTIAKGQTAHVHFLQPLGQFWINYLTNGLSSGGATPKLEQVLLEGSRRGVALADGNYNLSADDIGNKLIADDSLGITADFTITIPIDIYNMGSTDNSFGSFLIVNRSSYNCTIIADTGVFLNEVEEGTKIITPNTMVVIDSIASNTNDWQTFLMPTTLSGGGGASLIREDFTFGLSQTFTLANDYGQVYSVEVQGQGALSPSQYTLVSPNQVTINDTLNTGDYIVIIYSNAITGVQPYYSQAETDALVDSVAILKSVGPTYTTNAILTVTQAEYDALTPDATTLYVIL